MRQNAVAEIEDVPGPSVGQAQNVFGAPLQLRPRRKQQHGIEVALHGTGMSHGAPAFVEGNAPIQADDLRAGFRHRGQQGGAVGAEVDDGHVSFLLQSPDELRGGQQGVAAIIFHAQAADPTVEDLQHVGARAHLRRGVLHQHVRQLGDQLVPNLGRVVHQLLDFQIMPRPAALDHVAGQGKRRAAEADDRQLVSEVLDHQRNRIGDVSQFGGAIGAQKLHVFRGAEGLLDHRPFARGEMEWQAHDLQRQQQVGEDDGGVNLEELGGGDGDFGGQFRLLADFDQRMVLADVAVLLHVTARLAHEPYGSGFHRKPPTGAQEQGFGGRHKPLS